MGTVLIEDRESGSFARIAVHRGFNCFRFQARLPGIGPLEILSAPPDFDQSPEPEVYHGIPLLFPFPNRIADGKFCWDGRHCEMSPLTVPFDSAGHAIHGFCADRPWRVIEQTPDSVTGAFRLSIDAADRLPFWPADAEIQVRYAITKTELRSQIRVINSTPAPLPWGFGTHSYFRVPIGAESGAENCFVTVPAEKIWVLKDCLPTGQKQVPADRQVLSHGREFASLQVDDIYSDVRYTDGQMICRVIDLDAGVMMEQRCPDDFREIVVFKPPWSSSICMEPYTCVTNAINLQQQGIDAGLRVLPPFSEWQSWINIVVTRV